MGASRHHTFASILGDEFPFRGRCKCIQIKVYATREWFAAGTQNTRQAQENPLIHFVASEQIGVVAEIAQEPVQFPERFLGAIEPARNLAGGKLLRLENRETEGEEGFLRMPTIVGTVDSN